MKNFQPDYRHFEQVMKNSRPERLPIYEHVINPGVMEKVLNRQFGGLFNGDKKDVREFMRNYCEFYTKTYYDVINFEVCVCEFVPGGGALLGGHPGPIQNRKDFESYPWEEIPKRLWDKAAPRFDALVEFMPQGMKAVGGIGNGVFEISEDLVGLEYLPYIQVDDPDLYRDIYNKIGDTMLTLWKEFLKKYKDAFVACRIGDDLGFKSSLLTNPSTVRENIVPQYKKVIGEIHKAGKPFLWHSCGCIFEIMEDMIAAGINAKHSNEDAIAPFTKWLDLYSDRIAFAGGFDLDFLCLQKPGEIKDAVYTLGTEYRAKAKGYALGSGNSIPDYVPLDNYLAMIEGANKIRGI